jgi:hypothetical protein
VGPVYKSQQVGALQNVLVRGKVRGKTGRNPEVAAQHAILFSFLFYVFLFIFTFRFQILNSTLWQFCPQIKSTI